MHRLFPLIILLFPLLHSCGTEPGAAKAGNDPAGARDAGNTADGIDDTWGRTGDAGPADGDGKPADDSTSGNDPDGDGPVGLPKPPPGPVVPDPDDPAGGDDPDDGGENPDSSDLSCSQTFTHKTVKAGRYDVWLPDADHKVPLIVFNMGTGVSSGMVYRNFYPFFAKHGIAVVVNPDPMSMGAKSTMNALTAAHEQFADKLSDQLGATGHSQGGGAAWENGGRTVASGARINAVVGLQPGTFPGMPGSPDVDYLNLVGGLDQFGLGTNGEIYYGLVKTGSKFSATLDGADHMGMMNNPAAYKPYGEASALWFMCHLKGMECACEPFRESSCSGIAGATDGARWSKCKGDMK